MRVDVGIPGLDPVEFGDLLPEEIEAHIKKNLPMWQADMRMRAGEPSSAAPGFSEPFGGEAASAPLQPGEAESIKRGAYGNDATGASSAAAGGFVEGIPLAGVPLKAGSQDAAAYIRHLMSGNPYADELKAVRGYAEKTEAEHPVAKGVGEAAGTTAALAPVAVAAPGMLGLSPEVALGTNVLRAGTTGAVTQGVKAAEEGKTPQQIATESGIGAATFGATPLVGKAAGALVSKLMDTAAKTSGPLAGEDARALDWAISSLKRDNLLTDDQIQRQFEELGPHAFLAEYGPNLKGAAAAINAMPGEGKAVVGEGFGQRAAGARGRIEDAVTEALGPRVNINNLTAEGMADRSAGAKDLWDQFRATQVFPTQPVKDLIAGSGEGMQRVPGLQELGLLGEAQHMAQLEAAATGRPMPPMQNFFTTGERKDWPTTQSFQYIKQAIDRRIGNSYNDLGQPTQETRFYTQMKKRLDDTIKQANPEAAKVWSQAREAWANPTEVMNARRAGQEAFRRGTRRDEMLQELTDYAPPARAAYKQGARDAISEDMDATLNGDTSARNRLLAPANQEKLRYLATNKNYNAQTLIDKLEQEKAMGDSRNKITGNSETAAREAGKAMLTPNPEETLVAKARGYGPHVIPGAYLIPPAAERAAARAQEQSFEKSRSVLAPWLMKQGQPAADFAKALLAHDAATRPGRQVGPGVDQLVRLLSMGGAPQAAGGITPMINVMARPGYYQGQQQ
jgi:hypothetical protein